MITPSLAKVIIQEHKYKPITGKVLTLGKQLIAMTMEETLTIISDQGLIPNKSTYDDSFNVTSSKVRHSNQNNWISDSTFFSLLGVHEIYSIDVTDYEGADLIHDLNNPVDPSLHEKFDFIIDGGTFDHLLDLRISFENVCNLLKKDGRVIQWNAASNFTGLAYLSLGPDLFYDFYVFNNFKDCKVYIAEADSPGQLLDWDFYYFSSPISYQKFNSPRNQMVIVIAEKKESFKKITYPVQSQYRDSDTREIAGRNIKRVGNCSRPILSGNLNSSIHPQTINQRIKIFFIRGIQWILKLFNATITFNLDPKNLFPIRGVNKPSNCPNGFTYLGKL